MVSRPAESGPRHLQHAAVLEVDGHLDVTALARAFDDVRARHETLRTTIGEAADDAESSTAQPIQVVQPAQPRPLPLLDLSHLTRQRAEQRAAQLADAEARRAFDLVHGPLLRTRLLRLAADRHQLVVVLHHIIADGWSIAVLLRDLDEAYAARVQQRTPEWSPLASQYGAIAREQRTAAKQDEIAGELDWWRQRLEGLGSLELPTDFLRPSEPSERGFEQALRLDPALTRGLKELARQEGCTLFMALAAGVAAVLGRFANTTDVALGTPVAGRDDADTQELIGFFVNMLVLRIDLSGEPTFTTLLARTREATLEAFENRNVSFDQLVAALQPERAASRMPLLQVLLALLPAPEHPRLGALSTTLRNLPTGTAKFDLSLLLEDGQGDDIHGVLEASSDVFETSTIERLERYLSAFLAAAVAAPDTPIARLPLLDRRDQAQVLQGWARTEQPADAPPS